MFHPSHHVVATALSLDTSGLVWDYCQHGIPAALLTITTSATHTTLATDQQAIKLAPRYELVDDT